MNDKPILCERQGAVAIVTLNRPEKHNAISLALTMALAETVGELEADDGVSVIVLTGAGDKAFCAGADMAEALERQRQGNGAQQPGTAGSPYIGVNALRHATKPVIAAVNGFAYGLGAQLALCCDFRIASTAARFRFVSTSYGLVVSGADLPRAVGAAMAKELLYSTRVVDGEEAARIGLANRVVAPEALLPAVIELAQQIAGNSLEAVRWAKRIVDASTTLDAGYEVERESNLALRGTEDQSARFRDAAERVTGGGST